VGADALLVTHFLIAAFIVGGLPLVWIGASLRWRWVRNPVFRYLHLAAIALVALEAVLGFSCPLTVWEDLLRGSLRPESFVGRWVTAALYYRAPEWVFTVAYVAWAAATLVTLKLVPPARKRSHRRLGGRARVQGFTLLELLAVIGVVAILLLMAIPSYQHKIVREQVLEALPLADIAERPIAAAWQATQKFPANNASAGLPPEDKIVSNLVSAVAIDRGAIHITFGNRAHAQLKGKVLSLRPAVVSDAPIVPVAWICGYAPVPDKMTVEGENRSNVAPEYLPYKCRAD
jgi:type IV pilus assembly protein PilA